MSANTTVKCAIKNIKRIDLEYWTKTLEQRLPGGAGSVVIDEKITNTAELENALLCANWVAYDAPNLMPETKAFKAQIQGRLGIVDLCDLAAEKTVTLDDRKNTGKASVTINGELGSVVDFVTLIIGEEKGEQVCFTFHPGDPIKPSTVSAAGLHGKMVTVQEAIEMGFLNAKIIA